MPDCDVVLTVRFVPAQGKSYRINTSCTGGKVVVNSATDGNGNIAKAGEFVRFAVLPEGGYSVGERGFIAMSNGKACYCWYVGSYSMEALGMGTVHLYEMVMPAGDVDVIIRCTKSAAATDAGVRIPMTIR